MIDIGSNSVRLVVYDGNSRAPTPLFNEKSMCGLGKNVALTRRMPDDAVAKALGALRRFRALCDTMGVETPHVIATAAARDAENGPQFVAAVEEITRARVDLLSGKREAKLSAMGVVSGFYRPNGIVGDMGGGSLELIDVHGHKVSHGVSLPLGGLALADASAKSLRKADRIVRAALENAEQLKAGAGRTFFAVGGTWRALARLHMFQKGYPLHVMHGYSVPAREALEFSRLVHRVDPETLSRIDVINDARRPLLAYGAVVLEHIVRIMKPSEVVISAHGVREGLLFEMLGEDARKQDPLLAAVSELNQVRSRSPQHCEDLLLWSDKFMASSGIDETADDKRLRHAACLLADIGWRAHPDYRGEQSLNVIAHANIAGIDHPGRAFLALAVYYRHVGLSEEGLSPRIREMATTRMLDRARVLGASMRVAYLVSASMPGVLPRAPLLVRDGRLELHLKGELAPLVGDRLNNRLKQLAKLIGREPVVVTD